MITCNINSSWPSDVIWRHRSGSILAQSMNCYLTGPSYYLNQCWPKINEVLLVFSREMTMTIYSVLLRKLTVLTDPCQEALLLTWINFDISMDNQSHAQLSVGWNYLSNPNFNGCTVEVWEWISIFILHFNSLRPSDAYMRQQTNHH